jgi:hypothetical protein
MSFHREHHDLLLREWTVLERIFLIIGAFSLPGPLSRQLLCHASLARDLQVNNTKQVRVETSRLATLQDVNFAARKSTWVLQPNSWPLCPWGLYAFGSYPILLGLNTIETAIGGGSGHDRQTQTP